ncbi:MAG TPA: CPBP family intramembrane glutamic endopeptidase [Cryomorphaceae bacterium]|nr:CPBP family intramembrane glutamic endopeptidase [Cryomorphaceae bacterium]
MGSRPFSNADPFLQLIVLFLIAFFCVGIFMLMGQGLLNALWGVNLFDNPKALSDYQNENVVHMNRLLLFFQHLGLFVVPAIVFARLSSTAWKKYLGFRYVMPRVAIASALIIIAALPLINVLAWLNEGLALPDSLSGLEEVFVGMEETARELTMAIAGTGSFPSFLLNIVVVALLPAIGEEMIFRGLMIPIFRKWTRNVHVAVWLSAFLFSSMHFQFYGFLPRFVLGALLGYLFVWSKSLWAPILAHFVNNALALFLLFLIARGSISEEVDSFDPEPSDWLLVGFSVMAVAGLIYYILRFSKGWRDNRQAEKLIHGSEKKQLEEKD